MPSLNICHTDMVRAPPRTMALLTQLTGRRAYIQYERQSSCFWFNPVIDEHRPSSSMPGFPCNRGDIFLKLGMRGASRPIPWRLREGDVFRLGQAYVLVAKVRAAADVVMDVSALSPFDESAAAAERAERHASVERRSDRATSDEHVESDEDVDNGGAQDAPQCYICYEEGHQGDPLINPCQCAGSVKYVHLNCLQRWIQPEGSSAVNTHCPVCKVRYPEKTQAMMVRPPAILLESWSNHRALKLRHWVSFAQHGTASLGRFADKNDVVIPDHSVSGEHAKVMHSNDEFWLHDLESSNGTFIRLCSPLRLQFGESLHLKMGKSLLQLQAKRSRSVRLRDFNLRMRLVSRRPRPAELTRPRLMPMPPARSACHECQRLLITSEPDGACTQNMLRLGGSSASQSGETSEQTQLHLENGLSH